MSDVLGLDGHMYEAYQLLLHERLSSPARVSARLGISRSQADATLARLAAASLVAPSPVDPTQLAPLDPRRGLAPVIAHRQAQLIAQQQELSRSQEAFAALAAAYTAHDRDASSTDGDGAGSALPRGRVASRDRVEDLLATSRSTVMCVVDERAGPLALSVSAEAVERAHDRGVSILAVYARSTLADDAVRAHARWLGSLGGSVRTALSPPPAMLVVDRATALVPGDGGAFVVRNRVLAGALAALFDHVWCDAWVAAPASTHPTADTPTTQERDLLSLLGKGLTDASAARQLGVSLRTVRRMMAELMARLDARSRFEAGIRAAERGWVGSGGSTSTQTRLRRALGRCPSPGGETAVAHR